MFYATRRQVYCRFDTDNMAFANSLIWYHTHKQIYAHQTQGPMDWHINIYEHHLLCAHSSYLYHIELITRIRNLFYRSQQYLFFKNFSLAEVTYLLIRFSKTKSIPRNTKNTNRNRANKQKTYIPHIERKVTLERHERVN